MTKGRVLAAAAAAIAFFILSQTASAQYPPPKGSLVCAVAQSRVVISTNIYMTVTLIDTAGRVMPGQTVYFSVSSSTGGAYLSNNFGITDGAGQTSVTVFVGPNPGSVELTATSDGVACKAGVAVYAPPPPPQCAEGELIVAAGAGYRCEVRGVTIIQPPSTGSAGLAASGEGDGSSLDLLLYSLGGLGIVGLLLLSSRLVSSQVRAKETDGDQ